MTTLHPTTQLLASWDEPIAPDEAELAAVAFLTRYSGRTLDAYRHDLCNLFQWAADHDLAVLEATRAHLEMYRSSMEEGGLATSIPPCTPESGAGWTEESSDGSSSPRNGSTTLTPRSLLCSA
jgi:hypothetical protein